MHKRSYPLVALILVIVGLVSARRSGVEDMKLRVPTRDDWRLVGLVLSVFTVTLVPLALALGFIQWNPTPAHLRRGLIEPIPIFVFVALPEEIIFRGVIQKTAHKLSRNTVFSIALTSMLFGLAHLHKGGVFPNWRYGLLAALAGAGYGIAFRRRGLTAATLTHAVVDILWRTLFI